MKVKTFLNFTLLFFRHVFPASGFTLKNLQLFQDNWEFYIAKEVTKGGGSESSIIVGPSKSLLVYALHSLEYVLGLARFRVFVPKLYCII